MSQYKRQLNPPPPSFKGAKDMQALIGMVEGYLQNLTASIQREFTNVERSGGISQKETEVLIADSIAAAMGGGGGSSIRITDYFRTGTSAVTTAGTAILFSSTMGTTPNHFEFRCYDSAGATIGCDITLLTATGFTATPLENGTLTYLAVKTI